LPPPPNDSSLIPIVYIHNRMQTLKIKLVNLAVAFTNS
jgi:hypothetical protein